MSFISEHLPAAVVFPFLVTCVPAQHQRTCSHKPLLVPLVPALMWWMVQQTAVSAVCAQLACGTPRRIGNCACTCAPGPCRHWNGRAYTYRASQCRIAATSFMAQARSSEAVITGSSQCRGRVAKFGPDNDSRHDAVHLEFDDEHRTQPLVMHFHVIARCMVILALLPMLCTRFGDQHTS